MRDPWRVKTGAASKAAVGVLVLAVLAGCDAAHHSSRAIGPTVPPGGCSRNDLAARYVGGGDGGQTTIGEFVVWNKSIRPCQLGGRTTFTAYFAGGTRDRLAQTTGSLTMPSVTLRAGMTAFGDPSIPTGYLEATLAGPQFQASGLPCPVGARQPATFELSIGTIHIRAANRDLGAVQNKTLAGCRGRIVMTEPPLPVK